MENTLKPSFSPGAAANRTETGWQLRIPPGGKNLYRLAQLDDYAGLPRRHFLHSPPWIFSLRAKLSAPDLPGTWGFGLWNDPFGSLIGFGDKARLLPVLPNAAWFFYGSRQNWLSLHARIPGNGFFAGTITSAAIPTVLLTPCFFLLPLLVIKPFSRLLRKMACKVVRQDAVAISADVTKWHEYSLDWLRESVEFYIDGVSILKTPISPNTPLGLAIWVDNQFAAWTSRGSLSFGTLANSSAWMEIEAISIKEIPLSIPPG
jgi:hypothetical protein